MVQKLSDLPIGAKVKDIDTKYGGRPIIWLIADKDHQGYPSNSVTLISEKVLDKRRFDASTNRFPNAEIRNWLNDSNGLMKDFSNNFQRVIMDTTVGLNDNSKDRTTNKIFLASQQEVAYSEIFPLFTTKTSRVAYDLNNNSIAWWLRTYYMGDDAHTIKTTGDWSAEACNSNQGVRPVCNIKSSTQVSDNTDSDGAYTIIWNQPPIIESTTSTNMGVKSSGFSFTYKVTEKDAGQTLSVEEYVDNSRTKQFSATSGSTYTFSLSRLSYQKLLNGSHNVKIVARDNKGGVTEKVFNFSKNETKILFTLEEPLVADAMVTKAMINVLGSIPSGAILKVEACNNGNDSNPTWEDCTDKVLKERKIFLLNKQKTATKWGFNVRVSVDRNGTTGDCYISSVGGNFE